MLQDENGIIIQMARQYVGRCNLSLDDLIAAGREGLARARQKFDPSQGHDWREFAQWWVRQRMTPAIVERGTR